MKELEVISQRILFALSNARTDFLMDFCENEYPKKSIFLTMHMANATNSVCTLQYCMNQPGFIWDHAGLNYEAAKRNRPDVLEWAHENGCRFVKKKYLEGAIEGGHLHLLEGLECKIPYTYVAKMAATHNKLNIVEWAVQQSSNKNEIYKNILVIASTLGNLRIVEYALQYLEEDKQAIWKNLLHNNYNKDSRLYIWCINNIHFIEDQSAHDVYMLMKNLSKQLCMFNHTQLESVLDMINFDKVPKNIEALLLCMLKHDDIDMLTALEWKPKKKTVEQYLESLTHTSKLLTLQYATENYRASQSHSAINKNVILAMCKTIDDLKWCLEANLLKDLNKEIEVTITYCYHTEMINLLLKYTCGGVVIRYRENEIESIINDIDDPVQRLFVLQNLLPKLYAQQNLNGKQCMKKLIDEFDIDTLKAILGAATKRTNIIYNEYDIEYALQKNCLGAAVVFLEKDYRNILSTVLTLSDSYPQTYFLMWYTKVHHGDWLLQNIYDNLGTDPTEPDTINMLKNIISDIS